MYFRRSLLFILSFCSTKTTSKFVQTWFKKFIYRETILILILFFKSIFAQKVFFVVLFRDWRMCARLWSTFRGVRFFILKRRSGNFLQNNLFHSILGYNLQYKIFILLKNVRIKRRVFYRTPVSEYWGSEFQPVPYAFL